MSVVLFGASVLCGFTKHSASIRVQRQDLSVTITNSSVAPVELLTAEAALLASPTHAFEPYGVVASNLPASLGWTGRAQYRNRSKRSITAIQFRWEFFDAFDQSKDAIEVTANRKIQSGGTDEAEWTEGTSPADVAGVTVRVVKVRFDDGTIWTPGSPADELAQGGKPSEINEALHTERERLRKVYEEKGLQALLDALQDQKE